MVQGDTNDRWTSMVTISPGSPQWAMKVRFGWTWRRQLTRVLEGFDPNRKPAADLANLRRLAMIGFARWSMLYRIPSGVPDHQGTPLRRPFLLFESNFNGDHDSYLEAFSYVVPNPMNRVWDLAYDVPRVQEVSAWQRVVKERREKTGFYYYSAYPKASTKMIRTALQLERMLHEFRPRAANMTTQRFEQEFRGLLGRVSRLSPIEDRELETRKPDTGYLTTLIPVEQRRRSRLKRALEELTEPTVKLPATTHFARWCVVKQLRMPAKYGVDPTSYLLFSAWFDGNEADYAAALYEQLGADCATSIWSNCGFRGDSADEFADHLLRHKVDRDTGFAGYNGFRVAEVQSALVRQKLFAELAREAQGLQGAELQAAWAAVPELSQGA